MEAFNLKSIVSVKKEKVTFAVGISKLQCSLTVSLLPKFGTKKVVVDL